MTLVLMNAGGKTLSNGKTCSFVVGQKNGLANGTNGEYGYMNSSNTNAGGWDGCARRTWCNSVYYNAIPSTLRGIFKKFKNVTASAGNVATTKESEDYFALLQRRRYLAIPLMRMLRQRQAIRSLPTMQQQPTG